MSRRRLVLAACLLPLLAAPARAMEFHRVDDVLVMSGPVTGNELVELRNALARGPLRLVLLHESPGGDLWNGYHVGHRIRSEGLPTSVSGRCESACGLIFLGGAERTFSDGRPIAVTMVGLHGAHTTDTKQPLSQLSPRMAYVIRSLTGDKYPPELLQRTVYPRNAEDIVYAFHPSRFRQDGTPRGVFECLKQPDIGFRCAMVDGLDALAIGVITRPEVLELPPAVKQVLQALPPLPETN
ncbi:hypothetical protein GCM10028796_31870 [Ramlibacter monticola]|uniref:DUF4850 domain-containing protein n=1 Tax=Ramlibacter monticola TaxID=1926872 RepID=A0A936Z3F8_9BURK|nr:hypothetical protein [Ramlibacter monticola]MBL0394239.1 hypothetical protein [Ramlibacter monticola]